MEGVEAPTSEAAGARVHVLGRFRVQVGIPPRPVPDGAWKLRKAAHLVKLPALAPRHRLHREQIVQALWPDLPVQAGANALYQAVHAARRALEPGLARGAESPFLRVRAEVVSLDAPGGVWVDAAEFTAAAAAARRRREPGSYREALALYGELLPDDRYDDWAVEPREGMAALQEALTEELADLERATAPASDLGGAAPTVWQVPVASTPLIGREAEVAAVRQMLLRHHVRLATLTGPPGTGKTRLAIAVAESLQDTFGDGAALVSLAPVRDAALVGSATTHALGIWEAAGRPPEESLQLALRDKHLLVVFDNFEHVLPAAPLIPDLLAACPRLKVLVTSRALLRLTPEHTYVVPPLTLPDHDNASLARLRDSEAVRLFVERAQAVRPDFVLSEENGKAVAQICRRLDGLPLAIELAAARTLAFPPQMLNDLLADKRLALISGGARDMPERQHTLEAAIQWSYDLLAPAEQALFRRLGVFVGGFAIEAGQAVLGGTASGALEGVVSLVEKSLVRAEHRIGTARFGLLETVRDYALDQLAAHGEMEEGQRRHAAYFVALAQEAQPRLLRAEQLEWLGRLDREHDNLRAALRWCIERGRAGDVNAVETGLRIGGALGYWYWHARAHYAEAKNWLTALLALPVAAASTTGRGRALLALGDLGGFSGSLLSRPRAAVYEEAAAVSEHVGDRRTLAAALAHLSSVTEDLELRRARAERALSIGRDEDDAGLRSLAYQQLGYYHQAAGEHESARQALELAVAEALSVGDRERASVPLATLGRFAGTDGDFARGEQLAARALAYQEELGNRHGIGYGRTYLAALALDRGDFALARERYGAALRCFVEIGHAGLTVLTLTMLALTRAELGQAADALRVGGAAAAHCERAGIPMGQPASRALKRIKSLGSAALGADAERAWRAGQSTSVDDAVAIALAGGS